MHSAQKSSRAVKAVLLIHIAPSKTSIARECLIMPDIMLNLSPTQAAQHLRQETLGTFALLKTMAVV